MTVTKEQIECCGHDWDTWDADQNHAYDDTCQACWVTMPDWLEYVEAELDKLREAAQDYIEGGHFLDCKALRVTLKNPRCTCGHDALAAVIGKSK